MKGLRQSGQAVLEAFIVLGVLGSLWLGIAWLGRLQDVALQLSHASRRAAFAHAHQGLAIEDLASGGDGYLGVPGQSWHTRQGGKLLQAPTLLQVRSSGHAPTRQVGDPVARAAELRTELQLGDAAVWRAQAQVHTQGLVHTNGSLQNFDQLGLRLARHTAIMRGSGASPGDAATQAILGRSPQAWSTQADASKAAGDHVQQRLQGVDTAWGRSQPTFDWLSSWTGWIPKTHLLPWRQP